MEDTKQSRAVMSQSINLTGTSFQGVVPNDVTFQDLVRIFGAPRHIENSDSRVEWRGKINNRIFAIYDYKCPEIQLETLTGGFWHIGGFLGITAADVIQCITEKLSQES